MKGDSTTRIYTKEGRENHSKIKPSEPVGPYNWWRNRLTGIKMRLPVGVTAGADWEEYNG